MDIAIVGLSSRFEPGQDLAGWWRGLVTKGRADARSPAPDGNLRELLSGEALADAGVDPSGAGTRLASFLDGMPLAENLSAAIGALRAGTCDLALAGACPPEQGGGILALKRLEDCQRGSERVYAVIKKCRSWSVEDPVSGDRLPLASLGLLVVSKVAEARPEHLVEALEQAFGPREGELPECGLLLCPEGPEGTPVSAGCRSLVAATLALYHRVIPPVAEEAAGFAAVLDRSPFYANSETSLWLHGKEGLRRAGVFLPGRTHRFWVTLEAAGELGGEQAEQAQPPIVEDWPTELVLLSAPGRGELLARIRQLRERLESGAAPVLWELARELARAGHAEHRLAIIASSLEELRGKLEIAEGKLAEPGRNRLVSRNGIFFADPSARVMGKLAFLFPGQGSQYPNMLRELSLYFPQLRAWLDHFVETSPSTEEGPSHLLVSTPSLGLGEAGRKLAERGLYSMEGGAQVSFIISVAMSRLLAEFGVHADVMVGYSNGENSALAASGAWRVQDPEEFFAVLSRLKLESSSVEATGSSPKGGALAVSLAPRASIERELKAHPEKLFLTMDNCPGQVVLYGPKKLLAEVATRLRAEGALCFRLPFNRAYHTPLFEEKARHFRQIWEGLDIQPSRIPLYSCAIAAPYPEDPAGIRSLVAGQLAMQVRFRETIERLYADGVRTFVEVPPGGMLTGFVNDTLQGRKAVTTSVTIQNRSDVLQLQQTLALLFMDGRPVVLEPFFQRRGRQRRWYPPEKPIPTPAPAPAPALAPALAPVEPLQIPSPPVEGDRPPSAGLREELLQGHMELMSSFLANQQRIASLLGGQAVGSHEPAASEGEGEDDRWPLLGTVVERGPRSLYCRRTISRERDLYLADHSLGRDPGLTGELGPLAVVPFTFSMEMMAEAATRLVGELPVVELREVRGLRWLALDRGSLEIGIHAELESPPGAPEPLVRVRLFEVDARYSQGRIPLFEGLVRLAERYEEPPTPVESIASAGQPRWHPRELYERLYFHGPRFQSMHAFRALSPQGIDVEVEVPPSQQLLAGQEAPRLRLPASLIDGLGQLVGYWLLEQSYMYFGVFPFYVHSFRQYRPPPEGGTVLLCRTRVKLSSGGTSESGDFLDSEGRVVLRIEGMQSRYFDFEPRFLACLYWGTAPEALLSEPLAGSTEGARFIAPMPPQLFQSGHGIWLRALAHMVLGEHERELWYGLPAEGTGRSEWLLDRVAAKDALRAWAQARLGVKVGPRQIELSEGEGGMITRCPELQVAGPSPAVLIRHAEGRTIAVLQQPEPNRVPHTHP